MRSIVYVGLLAEWDWRGSALEVMEQLARAMQQHSELEVAPEVIWHLLAIASELKEEFVDPRRAAAVDDRIGDD